jgi:anti-sigma-K factor RskA
MTPTQEAQKIIRQYLLGALSDEDRERIEQAILTDGDVFAELLIIEDELTDEYVQGGLSADERARFENHFLTEPERQDNLRFARALNRYVATHPSAPDDADLPSGKWFPANQARFIPVAAAVAAVLMIAAALWFFLPRQPSPGTFATLTLSLTSNTRGDAQDQLQRVKLPLGKDALKIFLRLPNSMPVATAYRVQLMNSGGQSKSLPAKVQDAQLVFVEIAAAELPAGQYVLNLFAIKADGSEQRISGSYSFIVE